MRDAPAPGIFLKTPADFTDDYWNKQFLKIVAIAKEQNHSKEAERHGRNLLTDSKRMPMAVVIKLLIFLCTNSLNWDDCLEWAQEANFRLHIMKTIYK